MSTNDLSRSATDHRKHYNSVRAQQGRVFVDDDHNENERLHVEHERRSLVDMIGPAGTPDGGFLIKHPRITGGFIDFDIAPGCFYLGGFRLELESVESFQTQKDWLELLGLALPGPPAAGTSRLDLVYLEAWQQPVSAVEDNELYEVALGGPDTSTRMRLMRRVHVSQGVAAADCIQDWTTLIGAWSAAGLGTLNADDELAVNTILKVGFTPGNTTDLCSPPVAGGYLGANNQAVRVQLVDKTHLTWGFDNATPLYRVQVSNNGAGQPVVMTMLTDPKDQAHWPTTGQIVEVLAWSAVLANNEKLAEQSGFLARVDAGYDPDSKQFTITTPVPAGFGQGWKSRPDAGTLAPPEFFFLRVWNRGGDITSPPAIPFTTGVALDLGDTGLNVTISSADAHPADAHPEDYWIIAARPDSPNRVVPWLLETGRGPHGVRRFYTPLGIIEWDATGGALVATVIDDCRQQFPPLTRIRSCCTYTVGDEVHSFGKFKKIQDAVNALPAAGGEVCVLPGVYHQEITILNRVNIIIHGCDRNTLVVADANATSPVFLIQDSQEITLEDFAITAETVEAIKLVSTPAAEANKGGLRNIHIYDLNITVRDQSAIECRGGRFIRIATNDIHVEQLAQPLSNTSSAGTWPAIFTQADDVLIEKNIILCPVVRRLVSPLSGIQIGGGSERVEIRRNKIDGGNGNGITLGSVTWVPQGGAGGGGGTVIAGFNIVVDNNGCIHIRPDPTPTDPQGNPLTPVSDGDLYDIRIIENDILNMGSDGIGPALFFPVSQGIITVVLLDVEQNRITGCLQLDLSIGLAPGSPAGFGGIALSGVEYGEIRNNWIRDNGANFLQPVCGVYAQAAAGLLIDGNEISNNGHLTNTTAQPSPGPRAGIFVAQAISPMITPAVPGSPVQAQDGYPALRVSDNVVVSPMGPALHVLALGDVQVEANELTSEAVEVAAAGAASMGFVGPTTIAIGVVVRILDAGKSPELGLQPANYNTIGSLNYSSAGGAIRRVLPGGLVLFNDNQVHLALRRSVPAIIISSVLIVTADDISMAANQSTCRFTREILLTNALLLGFSLRMADNRFEERFDSFGFSAFTLAAMNSTTDNQGTRCFLPIGIPSLSVGGPNRSLVDFFKPFCADFLKRIGGTLQLNGLKVLENKP